jgi:PHD/YefM family antitoxin component YafN of YafNO toxin-antitoxin module
MNPPTDEERVELQEDYEAYCEWIVKESPILIPACFDNWYAFRAWGLQEIESLKETVHLLRSPKNAERLLDAIRSSEVGDQAQAAVLRSEKEYHDLLEARQRKLDPIIERTLEAHTIKILEKSQRGVLFKGTTEHRGFSIDEYPSGHWVTINGERLGYPSKNKARQAIDRHLEQINQEQKEEQSQ